jgi:hypothetical protein
MNNAISILAFRGIFGKQSVQGNAAPGSSRRSYNFRGKVFQSLNELRQQVASIGSGRARLISQDANGDTLNIDRADI